MADTSTMSQKKSWKTREKAPSVMHEMAVTTERVAEQLRSLRELHGRPDKLLPMEKAAQRAGVGHRQWQRWEGKETVPKPENLGKIAEAYGIPLDSFDDGAGPARSHTPLAERLDRIEEKLDEILKRLPASEPGESEDGLLGDPPGVSDPPTTPEAPPAKKTSSAGTKRATG